MFHNREMRRHPEMYGIHFVNEEGAGAGGGGGNVALLDKPATADADASAGDAGDTGDAGEGDADADADAAAASAAADTKPKYDAETQTLIDAAKAEARAEVIAETKTDVETKAQETARKERVEALRKSRETRDEAVNNLRIVMDENGEQVTYKLPATIEAQIKATLKAYDDDSAESHGLQFRDDQDRNMLALIPENDRGDVQKALDGAGDYQAHAKAFGEAYAPHSEAIKGMSLEELVKLSAKANTEHKALLRDAKREGRLLGQDDPEGEPVVGGAGGGAGGEMTYARYLKLKEPEKAKWADANPDAFSAFLGITKGK